MCRTVRSYYVVVEELKGLWKLEAKKVIQWTSCL